MYRRKHALGNRRGSSMLEFSLGAGILFFVFAGTFQFGYTFYQYNLLKNAVRNGAAYAALRPYDSSTSTPSSAFTTAVQNMVVYGDPAGGTTAVAPGLATTNVKLTATFSNGTTGIPTAMKVYIDGYTINSVVSSVTLTKKPQATYAYQGIFEPY